MSPSLIINYIKPQVKQIKAQNLSKIPIALHQSSSMSTAPFTRTNRNTPQRNLNKSQQPTEASFTPSQPSTVTDQVNKGGFVYKPPAKIVRSNVNTVKEVTTVEEKNQPKRQEPAKQTEPLKKIQQPSLQKPASIVRKPATEITRQTTARINTLATQIAETKTEVNLVAVKSVSKLPIVRTNESSVVRIPKKDDKQEAPKPQQIPTKTVTLPYPRTKPTVQQKATVQQKPIVEPKPTLQEKTYVKPPTITKNPLQKLTQDPTKTIPISQIKKPSPLYSYPKKINQHESQKQSQTPKQPKQQSSKAIEQSKPQTPKFREQQNAPQLFTSTYANRNKNASIQVPAQSSQSSTALKNPYQSAIHAPVDKIAQIQKPASTIIDTTVKSPVKTPLLQGSRYINKVETPLSQEKVVENQNSEQQASSKQPVKRSPLLGYALHRLYVHKMTSHLQQMVRYSKNIKQNKKNQKIHQYFQRSLIKFIKVYEQNILTQSSFGLMKSIYSKLVKLDMTKSTDPKVTNQLTANRNQTFGKVLQNIIPSVVMELRFSFVKLKSNLNQQKSLQVKRETGIRILSGVELRKMKQNFLLLSEWTKTKHQTKVWKLSRCSQINCSYKKWLIVQTWMRVVFYKLKQNGPQVKISHPKQSSSRLSLNKVAQKTINQVQERQGNVQLRQKVSQLQKKLSQAEQKSSKIPKQSDLRKALQQLKQQKKVISQEISVKKQRNTQLKQRVQSLISKASHQSLSSLSEQKKQQQESTLSLLHQIYMSLYKQPQNQCTSQQNLNSLYTIHQVQQKSISRQVIVKWLAIQENMSLKHWINLYEGNYVQEAGIQGVVGQRKLANRQMEEENQLVKKFIKSYVKERYMWQEVKGYVAAVIGE